MQQQSPHTTLAILGAAFAATLAVLSSPAAAQAYPTRPVTIINPLATGGGADNFLRALAREMEPLMGQPVLVVSRPGAGGLIAGEYVARSKPDGYVIGDLQSTHVLPEVFDAIRKAPYSHGDLRFAVRVFYLPSAMVSRAGAPWNDMADFVKHTQANPGKVTFAQTAGEGHPLHLLARSIFKKNQMSVVEVPFKGAGDAVVALLGGHVDAGYPLSISAVQAHGRSGKLSILAVDSAQRNPNLPAVPTLKELGFDPGMAPNYHIFTVPKGTPDAVVQKINDVVKQALESPAIKEYARRNVVELYYGSEKDATDEVERNRGQIVPALDELLKQSKQK